MRGLTFSLIATVAMAGAATLVAAQQPQQAGVSAAVRGQVALARASQNIVGKQVESGDPIFLGDAITSGRDSGMQVMLLDETVFSIGPNSEIAIDEFVYDPSTESGKVTASVAKGVFRFITGKIARKRPEDMTVRLPTATIGIRGTIVAGAVREAAGRDPDVDKVFNGLKGAVANGENARDFVVLLGPGHENNTNDRGGAFVFVPRPPERSESGLSAGAAPPAAPAGISGLAEFTVGEVEVSRAGSAAVGYRPGVISDVFTAPPDVTQGLTGGLSAQPPGGPAGSPDDSNAQQANNTSANDADSLSGNTIAEAAAGGQQTAQLGDLGQRGSEITDPAAGSGAGAFDFDDLRAITTGQAFISGSISSTDNGTFSVSSFNIDLFFNDQQMQMNFVGIQGGGIPSSGNVQCFSSCFFDYSDSPGAAVFKTADNPNVVRTNCDNCNINIAITSADAAGSASANVTIIHDSVSDSVAVSN